MPTLLLLRHAQAANFAPGKGDHARPLTPRGHEQAARVGTLLASTPIDQVLCSTSTRTRETLAELGLDCPVEYLDAIYQAGSDTIARLIGEVDDAVGTLLVVGHAPGIPTLAHVLAGEGSDAAAVETLDAGYPTATLTRVEVNGWDLHESRVTAVHTG